MMDFLTDIWRFWNDQLGTSLAAIVALYALLKSAGKDVRQMVAGVIRWKAWRVAHRLLRYIIRRYRSRRAKRIIRRLLEGVTVQVGIRNYDDSLRSDPWQSTRDRLSGIIPDKPRWLNDHYVATALESLLAEGRLARAIRFSPQSWPPDAVEYHFAAIGDNGSAQRIATEIEVNSKCLAYQNFSLCPESQRFEVRVSRETVSPTRTRVTTSYPVRDAAPPCKECWKSEHREFDMRMLVESFLKNEFADIDCESIAGGNGELAEALVSILVQCAFPPEVRLIKPLVEQAITIRRGQISARTSDMQDVWQADEKEQFTAMLERHIKSQSS